MHKLTRSLVLVALSLLSASCASYTGVSKADGQLYISGMTSYFIFSTPWVRRCEVDGTTLKCEELTEETKKRERGDEGGSTTGVSSEKAGEKPADKGGDKPAEKPADKPADKPLDKK